jgi:hypothetical protein
LTLINVIKLNLTPNFNSNTMKKGTLLILLFLGFNLNAQTFKKDNSLTGVDLIQISTLKKRILGIESLESFNASKDTIISKYNARTVGDESLYYEYHNDKYWIERSYVKFYVYDFQSRGNLNTTFNLGNGIYNFEFYSNGKIVKSFIGTLKRGRIVNKINTTSQFDYKNNFPKN